MRPFKARYVTVCQQLLALAVVLAVLTPATAVISMEVVQRAPGSAAQAADQRPGTAADARRTSPRVPTRPAVTGTRDTGQQTHADDAAAGEDVVEEAPAQVSAETVEPTITEVALTEPAATEVPDSEESEGEKSETVAPEATQRRTDGRTVLVSDPQPVSGFGAVGVTWSAGTSVAHDAISFEVRSLTDGAWGAWGAIDYHDHEAPDPDSAEAAGARPGTEAIVVGDVDEVQVRVTSDQALPADMVLAVVDPGKDSATVVQEPAIDTAADPDADGELESSEGDISLRSTVVTQKPKIFSRAQWGADESLRGKSSLSYYEVHAGFVHHTVSGNNYSRAEVPSILRGIYAYHTRSRGWSDIGYNFLVDRFGRIWEGRYGGVDRPVVGAHTLGYNDYAFAMSAIGNFDVARPSDAVLRAYGKLFAWKLSLHGVNAGLRKQRVGPRTFRAISGHRDAGSTACPGRYLYAKIPAIRRYAVQAQRDWSGRELNDTLAGKRFPDLIVRRASDHRLFTVPTGGLFTFGVARVSAPSGYADKLSVAVPDMTGDRHGDLLVRRPNGSADLRRGDGKGAYRSTRSNIRVLADADLVASVGDLDGDKRPDLVIRRANGDLQALLRTARGSFRRVGNGSGSAYNLIAGTGDLTGDGKADLVVRTGGKLAIRPGAGDGTFGAARAVRGSYGGYDVITGGGDLTKDGIPDLFLRKRSNAQGWVLPGRGNGTFDRVHGPIHGLKGYRDISIAPSMRSADPDLVAVSKDRLVVRPHPGKFDLGRPIDTGQAMRNINRLLNVGDWDRDGRNDVVVRTSSGNLRLLRGNGNGTLKDSQMLARGFGNVRMLAAVGDVTGDGYPDLMGQPKGSHMKIYPGRGLKGVKRSYRAYSALSGGAQVGIGRWNSDGAPDNLIRRGKNLRMYPGNGPGGLTTGGRDLGVDLSAYDWVLGVSSITGNGKSDVIVRQRANGRLWVLQGTSSGFKARRYLGYGMGVYNLAD